jgi:hypothetical protein
MSGSHDKAEFVHRSIPPPRSTTLTIKAGLTVRYSDFFNNLLRLLDMTNPSALIDVVDVSPAFRRDPKQDFHPSPDGIPTLFLDRLSRWQ